MTDPIHFTVPGVPTAQPRARATAINGKAMMHDVTTITNPKTGARKPHPIAAFKATVRLAAKEAYDGPPLSQPLRVDLLFVFPRTKATIWKTKEMPRYWHTKKPDRDNLDKAVLDALTGQMWTDDCQVCDGRIIKIIADGDEQPRTEVSIVPLPDAVDLCQVCAEFDGG